MQSVHMREPMPLYVKSAERLPDPGAYDKHLKPFGAEAKTFNLKQPSFSKRENGQSRRDEWLNTIDHSLPGPGIYNTKEADALT
jgi:hypothetical protein